MIVFPFIFANNLPGNRVDSKCAGITTLKFTNLSGWLSGYSDGMWRASSSSIIGIPSLIGKASLHGLHASSLFPDCKSSPLLHMGHTNISRSFLSTIIFNFFYDGLCEFIIDVCSYRQKPTFFSSKELTFYRIFFCHYDDITLD